MATAEKTGDPVSGSSCLTDGVPVTDLTGAELFAHRSLVEPPAGLDRFWADTLEESRALSPRLRLDPVDTGLRLTRTWDVTYGGFGGDPVRAWYHRPAAAADALPVVVRYQGYGGGRGLPHETRCWVLAGYAVLEVDTRGQGAGHRRGDTPDPAGTGPSTPGFVTRGVRDPATYYYRRVYADAVLAAELAAGSAGGSPGTASAGLPGAGGPVVVAGESQGGALALAAAALARPGTIAGALVDVPFLCDIMRAVDLCDDGPYPELATYLSVHRTQADAVRTTIALHDGAVLATRATCPALFSAGGMDPVCPPSTVYAAYNAYAGPKAIEYYHFNGHEGGGAEHERVQLDWVARLLAA